MYGPFGFIPPEVATQIQAKASEAKIEAKAEAEVEAKKTPEEKLSEAKERVLLAGQQFCGRILGMLDRETGKLTDQFTILKDHKQEVVQIVTKSFLLELDKEMRERGYIEDDEE